MLKWRLADLVTRLVPLTQPQTRVDFHVVTGTTRLEAGTSKRYYPVARDRPCPTAHAGLAANPMLFAKRQIMTASAVVLLSVSVRADLSARWELHADFDDRSIPGAIGNCVFKQEGQHLSGTCEDAALSGEVSGETVTFR